MMCWAGRKLTDIRTGEGESDGQVLTKGTCLASLLAGDGESEELEEAGEDWETLEMPAAMLGVLKKPATNLKT